MRALPIPAEIHLVEPGVWLCEPRLHLAPPIAPHAAPQLEDFFFELPHAAGEALALLVDELLHAAVVDATDFRFAPPLLRLAQARVLVG
jgi:hypothetical protein